MSDHSDIEAARLEQAIAGLEMQLSGVYRQLDRAAVAQLPRQEIDDQIGTLRVRLDALRTILLLRFRGAPRPAAGC